MPTALGIDTSNYTTSAAIYSTGSEEVVQRNKTLPVKQGEIGLRQSDAVFLHVKQLPEIINELYSDWNALHAGVRPSVIGVSSRPRPVDGSYMPCFEVGRSCAEQLGTALGIPVLLFSHQEGHIAAALYSSGFPTVKEGRSFIAFHLSGGTTEAVKVTAGKQGYTIDYLAGSLDLKAGQLVDRVAAKLGLPFPGGACLEKLALTCDEDINCRPSMKGADCCLSGVENVCERLLAGGAEKALVARTCLAYISRSVSAMTKAVYERTGELPLLFAGGVSSNAILRADIEKQFDAYFAPPEFSRDNAAGVAILAAKRIE